MKEKLQDRLKFVYSLVANSTFTNTALQAVPFWIASLLAGFIAVSFTRLFIYTEGVLQSILHWQNWLLFIITPVSFLFAWLIVRIFAPNAKGSGIPQVMAAIELSSPKNSGKVDLLLSIRIAVIKMFSSLLMVLGGGAIGREGPTIQIAGSVFYVVQKYIPSTWPKLSKQAFILTGASAGLAAAFNTPLGGLVFAIEELSKIHIRFFRTALFSAVIIAGLTAQAILGPYLYLGYPNVSNLQFSVFFAVAATAIIAGFLGALFGKMALGINRWKKNFSMLKNILFIIIVGLAIATFAFYVNKNIIGSGKDLMNSLLFTSNKHATWDTVIARVIGTTLCFNTGAAGGVFAPSLAAGASVGAFVSGLFDIVGSNANILILSGMVGFLTGVTRTPFTSAILVLEMTDRHTVIFHLLLAAMISNAAALLIDKHSLYDSLKHDYLDDNPGK